MRTTRGVCRRCGARKAYPSVLVLPLSYTQTTELERGQLALFADTASSEELSG